jgi:hypothetical protein
MRPQGVHLTLIRERFLDGEIGMRGADAKAERVPTTTVKTPPLVLVVTGQEG